MLQFKAYYSVKAKNREQKYKKGSYVCLMFTGMTYNSVLQPNYKLYKALVNYHFYSDSGDGQFVLVHDT